MSAAAQTEDRGTVSLDAPERSLLEVRRVAVSLRRSDRAGPVFLADHQVQVRDGVPEPLDHEGRRYVFRRTTPTSGYRAGAQAEVYMFEEVTPGDALAAA